MRKLMDIAAIIGNVFGAMLVAVGTPAIQIAGYLFFCIGCGATIWLLTRSNASRSLLLVSIYFLVVNVIGIIARIPSIAPYVARMFA